jgi:hypothetical protein
VSGLVAALADEIRRAATAAVVRLAPRQRLGVVATTSPLTVTLGGDTAAVPAATVSGYVPLAGDTVTVLVSPGAVPLILTGGLGLSTAQADVATAESTTSTTFVDLTTPGPTISNVVLRAGEPVMVYVSYKGANALGAGHASLMSYAVSGADTVAAQDADGGENDNSVTATIGRWSLYTPATAGAHTFTSKYRTISSGTSTFAARRIIVRRG